MKMINESLSHNRDTEHFSCRNIYVDVIKGIAIFLMLWGHCIQYCYAPNGDFFSDMTFKVIYSFHMPLLMLISGYLFAITAGKYSKDVLLSKKASAIIHPIIGGNILCFLLTTALVQIVFKKNLHILIGGGWLNSLEELWFLWCVLTSTIIMCMIEKYAKTWYQHTVVLVIGVPIILMFPQYIKGLWLYPFFVCGYYYGKWKNKFEKIEWIKYCSIPLFLVMIKYFGTEHYIYTTGLFGDGNYSVPEMLLINCFRWSIGLVGSIAVITIIGLLVQKDFLRKILSPVAMLGKKSLQIYILSTIFVSTYLKIGLNILRKVSLIDNIYLCIVSNPIVYDLLFTLIIAVGCSWFLVMLCNKLDKIGVSRYIFGR